MAVRTYKGARDSTRSERGGGSARFRRGMDRRLAEKSRRMANRRPSEHREGQCSTPLKILRSRPTRLFIHSKREIRRQYLHNICETSSSMLVNNKGGI